MAISLFPFVFFHCNTYHGIRALLVLVLPFFFLGKQKLLKFLFLFFFCFPSSFSFQFYLIFRTTSILETMLHLSITSGLFAHLLTVKLDRNNFLLWRQQAMATIRCHNLQCFVLQENHSSPPEFLTELDQKVARINPKFTAWQQQDQLLVCWLLSSMSESILPHMVGSNTIFDI